MTYTQTVTATITSTTTATVPTTVYGPVAPTAAASANAKCGNKIPGSTALFKANGKPGCCVPIKDSAGNVIC